MTLAAKPIAIAGSVAVALSLAFGAGWMAQGWRKNAEIADINTEAATARADGLQGALDNLAFATGVIKTKAEEAQSVRLDFTSDIGILSAELKNEIRNNNPLPVGCKPDAGRVRSLDATIDAANKAIAR